MPNINILVILAWCAHERCCKDRVLYENGTSHCEDGELAITYRDFGNLLF